MPMHRFDIFERSQKGPIWIEAVGSIEQAKERLETLAATRGGAFLLFDTSTAAFVQEVGGDAFTAGMRARGLAVAAEA